MTLSVIHSSEINPHPVSLGMNRFVRKPVTIFFLKVIEHMVAHYYIVVAVPEVASNQQHNHES